MRRIYGLAMLLSLEKCVLFDTTSFFPFSLRFKQPGHETALLRGRRRLLNGALPIYGVACAAVHVGLLLHEDDVQADAHMVISSVCAFLSLQFVWLHLVERFRDQSVLVCEGLAMLATILVCINVAITQLHSEGQESVPSSSVFILQAVSVIVTIVHAILPIRWIMLVPLQLIMLIYVVIGFLDQSPTNHEVSVWYCAMLVLQLLAVSFGKWILERHERSLILLLFEQEATLRIHQTTELAKRQAAERIDAGTQVPKCGAAELQRTLETAWPAMDVEFTPEEDSRSANDSDSSSVLCKNSEYLQRVVYAKGREVEALQSLESLGTDEHWLIKESELRIFSSVILGSGGFSIVVAGSYQGSPAAIKIPVHSDKCNRPGRFADVGNELLLLRRIRHPNIICFHGACFSREYDNIALVLELAHGATMEAFILSPENHTGELPSRTDRCELLLGICRALCHLHSPSPKVLHGDLKPSNVLVERKVAGGRKMVHPKLLDFGLGRICVPGASALGGSVNWAPPEAAIRELDSGCSTAPDVFSFGRIIFFSVTGRQPLADWTPEMIRDRVWKFEVPELEWPDDVQWILPYRRIAEPAMSFFPKDRPVIQQIYAELCDTTELEGYDAPDVSFAEDETLWQQVDRIRQVQLELEAERCETDVVSQQGQLESSGLAASISTESGVLSSINTDPRRPPGSRRGHGKGSEDDTWPEVVLEVSSCDGCGRASL